MRAQPEPGYKTSHKLLPSLLTLVLLTAVSIRGVCLPAPVYQPANVQVSLVGRAGSDPTLASRISSWFDSKRFRVTTRTVGKMNADRVLVPETPGTIYVWVSVGPDDVAHLYFATTPKSTQQPTYLVRELPLSHGLDELGAERIGQILHMSTVAIVNGQAQSQRNEVERRLREETTGDGSGPSKSTVSASSRPNPGSPHALPHLQSEQSERKFDLGVGYGIGFHGDEGVWHGPRASLEYFWHHAFGVGAVIRTALPTSREIQGVTLSVKAMGAQAFVGWHTQLASSVNATIYAGPGLEIVQHQPTQATDPEVTLNPSQTETRPNLLLGLGVVLGNGTPRVALSFEVAALFSPRSYELVDRHGHSVSAQAAELSPSFGLELRF